MFFKSRKFLFCLTHRFPEILLIYYFKDNQNRPFLISAIILSRHLGVGGYGLYSDIIAIVSILSIPASAGLPQPIIRKTSLNLATKEFQMIRGLWQWAAGIVIKNSIFIIIVALITILLYSRARENAGIILWALKVISAYAESLIPTPLACPVPVGFSILTLTTLYKPLNFPQPLHL